MDEHFNSSLYIASSITQKAFTDLSKDTWL